FRERFVITVDVLRVGQLAGCAGNAAEEFERRGDCIGGGHVVDELGCDARVLKILLDELGVLFVEFLRRGCGGGRRRFGFFLRRGGGQCEGQRGESGDEGGGAGGHRDSLRDFKIVSRFATTLSNGGSRESGVGSRKAEYGIRNAECPIS